MIPRIARRTRGTVIAYFLVLVSVLTTGLLTTMALSSGAEARMAGMTLKRDQAFYAAEAGIQRAFYELQNDNNWRASADTPLTGTVGSASYSVVAIGDWNSPVSISSTGMMGSGAQASSITVTAAASPTVIVPAISLGNNFDNSGNVTINGDVQAKGIVSTSGKLKLTGSLYAGGSITTNGSVTITGTTNPNTPNIPVPTVDTAWLKSHATQVITVPNGNHNYTVQSLNFGQGGIIYMQGGANTVIQFKGNVTITGYGTLITDTDVKIQSSASFGSSSSPANVNLVSGGGIDIGGYLGIVGSVVSHGVIDKNGGLDITGVVVGDADLDTNGGLTINRAQPPGWIHYPGGSGEGSIKLSRVTGPIF